MARLLPLTLAPVPREEALLLEQGTEPKVKALQCGRDPVPKSLCLACRCKTGAGVRRVPNCIHNARWGAELAHLTCHRL